MDSAFLNVRMFFGAPRLGVSSRGVPMFKRFSSEY